MNAEARPILVVGGGFAGLSAAWQLRAAGLPVVVLEQASKPGGRACGERIEGFSVESRLPLVSSGASRLRNFMAAVGVQEGLRILDGLDGRPSPDTVLARAEIWRPLRSVAAWYLWRLTDG